MAPKAKSARRLNPQISLKSSKFTHERHETYEIPFAYFSVIRGFLLFVSLMSFSVFRGHLY